MATSIHPQFSITHQAGPIITGPQRPAPLHWPIEGLRNPAPGLRGFSSIGAALNLIFDPHGDAVEVALSSGPPDWHPVRVAAVVQIRQRSSGRWVESHGGVVLTVAEPTGRAGLWVVDDQADSTSIRHLETAAFLGAETDPAAHAFTQPANADHAPVWVFDQQGASTFTIERSTGGQFLDAHESGNHRVVTRPAQHNASQVFDVIPAGAVYSLVPEFAPGRFLDAHVAGDFNVVTRPAQNNDTQEWAIVQLQAETFWPVVTIQQVATGRYLTALPGLGGRLATKPVKLRRAIAGANQTWSMSAPVQPVPPVE